MTGTNMTETNTNAVKESNLLSFKTGKRLDSYKQSTFDTLIYSAQLFQRIGKVKEAGVCLTLAAQELKQTPKKGKTTHE